MKKIYLLLVLTYITQFKTFAQEASNPILNYGKELLESLKESDPKKILSLSVTIEEFKKTVNAKTPEKFKSNFFADVAKENTERIRKRTVEHFNRIKQNKEINWQNAKFVDFKFKRENRRSDNLGFDWGPGTLLFKDNGQQYELKVSEMTQLLSGWKGMGFRLNKIEDKTLENYGKAFFEVLKTNDYDKLYSLCMSGEDLVNTVNKKTQIKEIKDQVIENFSGMTTEKWQGFIKREFDRNKKKYPISWQGAEYQGFKFEKNEGDSQDINFEWGKAILYFKYDKQNYKFKFGEFALLLTGWKGNNFRFELD